MKGIPYQVVGGTNFYARREIKDLLAYLKTIDNGKDDVAVKRIINIPRRGIGATTIQRVQDYADERNISFYDALREADQIMPIGKSAAKLKPFVTMIQAFRSKLEFYNLEDLLKDILETTGYVKELEASNEDDAQDRIENIDELLNKVITYDQSHEEPNLSEFLEEVALVADIDQVENDKNRVLLMTLHSAKGLEFPHVYLAGMEDGIFPSYMTITADDPAEIEEERRLAYVGITRAKDDLTMTCARQRMVRGETQYNPVSRFVKEIPPLLLDHKLPEPRYKKYSEYEDDSYERGVFRKKPFEMDTVFDKPGADFSNSYTGSGAVSGIYTKPKATARPKRTPMEEQPYLIRAVAKQKAEASGNTAAAASGSRLGYEKGDRVRHLKYGEGTVMNIEPGARDYQVTVVFDNAGQKIMYAGFAKLKKI